MTCKLCPTRKHCWDKGYCEDCEFGKAFEGCNRKIKKLKEKSEKLEAENAALRQRLAETENGYEQTLYLERLKNKDLKERNESLLQGIISQEECKKILKKAKHEAIKRFARMLKPKIDCEYGNKFYRDKCFEEIDNLVKEMTGEQE